MKLPASFKLAGLGTYCSPYYIDTNDLILQAVPQTDVPSSFINEAWILFIVQFNLLLRTLDSNVLHITLPKILRFLSEKNQTTDLGGILVELCTFTNVDYLRTTINTTTTNNNNNNKNNTDTDNSSYVSSTEENKNDISYHDDHNHFHNTLFHSTRLLSPSKTTANIINPIESSNDDHGDNDINNHRKDSNTSYNSSLSNNHKDNNIDIDDIDDDNEKNDDVNNERLTISKDSTTDSRKYFHQQQHIKNKKNFINKQSSMLLSLCIYIAQFLYSISMYIYNNLKYYIKIYLIKSQLISDDYQIHDPHGYSLSLHEMCIAIRDGKLSLGIMITHPKVMIHNYIIQNDDYYDSDVDDDNNDDNDDDDDVNNDEYRNKLDEDGRNNDDSNDDEGKNNNEYDDNIGEDSHDDDDDDANKCMEKNEKNGDNSSVNDHNATDYTNDHNIATTNTTTTAATTTTTTTTTATHTTLTSLISIIDHGIITPRKSNSSNNNNTPRNSRSSNRRRNSQHDKSNDDFNIPSDNHSYTNNDIDNNNHDDNDNDDKYIQTTYGKKASEIAAYYNIMKVADRNISCDGSNRNNIATRHSTTRQQNSIVRMSENRNSDGKDRYNTDRFSGRGSDTTTNPMNSDNLRDNHHHHYDYHHNDDQHRDFQHHDDERSDHNFSEFLDYFPSDRYTLTIATHSSLSKDNNMNNTININDDDGNDGDDDNDDKGYNSTTNNNTTATINDSNITLSVVRKRLSMYDNNRPSPLSSSPSIPVPSSSQLLSSPQSSSQSPPISPTRQAQVTLPSNPTSSSSSSSCIMNKHIHIDHLAYSTFQMPLNIWRYRSSNKEYYSHGLKYMQYLLLSSSTNNNTSSTNCSGDKNNNNNNKSWNRSHGSIHNNNNSNNNNDNNKHKHNNYSQQYIQNSNSLHFYNSTYNHHHHSSHDSYGGDDDGRQRIQQSRQDSSDDLNSNKAVDGGNSNNNSNHHIHVNILESILNQKSTFNTINNNNIPSTTTSTNKATTTNNNTTNNTTITSMNTIINEKESKVTLDLIIDPSMITSHPFKQYIINNKSLPSNTTTKCSPCMSVIGYVCWDHYFIFNLKNLFFGKMIEMIDDR